MFSSWLISLVSGCCATLVLLGIQVETTVIPHLRDASLDSIHNGSKNVSGSDIDYEVYAYYLPFLKEQNVSNDQADYSYYESDYLNYYSYDKSAEGEKNQNHLTKSNIGSIDKSLTRLQNSTEPESLTSTTHVDGLLTVRTPDITTNGIVSASDELRKPSTKQTVMTVSKLLDVVDSSLQVVTKPDSPDGSRYKGISVTDSNLQDVKEQGNFGNDGLLTKITGFTIREVIGRVGLNATKDREQQVHNICLRSEEVGSDLNKLFPCSSFELQSACIGLDYRIEACSETNEVNGTARQICVKRGKMPYIVACSNPMSEDGFCFESSARDTIIPCKDNRKRVCLFEKGNMDVCSAESGMTN